MHAQMMKQSPKVRLNICSTPAAYGWNQIFSCSSGMSLGNSSATAQSFPQNGNLGKGQGNALQAKVGEETSHKAVWAWLLCQGSRKRKVIVFPWRKIVSCYWALGRPWGLRDLGFNWVIFGISWGPKRGAPREPQTPVEAWGLFCLLFDPTLSALPLNPFRDKQDKLG